MISNSRNSGLPPLVECRRLWFRVQNVGQSLMPVWVSTISLRVQWVGEDDRKCWLDFLFGIVCVYLGSRRQHRRRVEWIVGVQKDCRVTVADTPDRSDARQLSGKMRTLQENYCQRLLRTSWDTVFKKLMVDQLRRISRLMWGWKFHDGFTRTLIICIVSREPGFGYSRFHWSPH
jgi:hypothetical protein